MGILSRLLLFCYVLVVIAALAAVTGVCLNLIPAQIWQNYLDIIIKSQETLMVVAIMAVASLCLLCMVFSGKKSAPILSSDVELKKDATGEVKITIEALTGVVERAALTVTGVREVRATVYKQEGKVPLKIRLELALSQGYTAQTVGEKVNLAVNDALMTAAKISGVPVEIKITEVTHAVIERERRVV
ncbi:MAG: alkaline shock response membrane anchor protein AmaP [Selenomonadaceae bacterium]|nr:alkaline shock response membrane anchor protein AmaP [Selenomonadaceae bacterium]MBQ7629511.1 alkaline shock response membrane anchor protein AmaP [Selenomonadaceae bacterium]